MLKGMCVPSHPHPSSVSCYDFTYRAHVVTNEEDGEKSRMYAVAKRIFPSSKGTDALIAVTMVLQASSVYDQ